MKSIVVFRAVTVVIKGIARVCAYSGWLGVYRVKGNDYEMNGQRSRNRSHVVGATNVRSGCGLVRIELCVHTYVNFHNSHMYSQDESLLSRI